LSGVFAVDLISETGDLRSLLVVPMVMRRLALCRAASSPKFGAQLGGSVEDLTQKVNELSRLDSGGVSGDALFLHSHADSAGFGVWPKGPVLVWT